MRIIPTFCKRLVKLRRHRRFVHHAEIALVLTTMAVLRGSSAISFVFDPRACDRAICDRHVKRYSMYRIAFAKRTPSVGRPAGPSLFKQRFVVISSNTTAPVQSKKQRESHLTAEYATHRPKSLGAPSCRASAPNAVLPRSTLKMHRLWSLQHRGMKQCEKRSNVHGLSAGISMQH